LFSEAIENLAGHTFTAALEFISDDIQESLGGELRKELKFGLPVREALMNLADRLQMWSSRAG